jgi:1,4-alpha-glucan branching enzyme
VGDIHRVYFAPDDRYGGPEGMKRPLCNRPGPSGVSVLVGGGEPG